MCGDLRPVLATSALVLALCRYDLALQSSVDLGANRPERLFDDVVNDVVGRVVASAGPPLSLVGEQVDGTLWVSLPDRFKSGLNPRSLGDDTFFLRVRCPVPHHDHVLRRIMRSEF